MPDPQPAVKPVVALIMLISAVSLGVLSGLIYTGIVPLPEASRGIAALVVGLAAAGDFVVGLWFFRKSQSS